jgi:hypothetical protein
MFSTLCRRWFNLFAALMLVFMDLLPLNAFANTTQFSVAVKTDCLSCTLAKQFPNLQQQLQGEVSWSESTRRFGKQTLSGLAATASSSTQSPPGLKPLEQQAWLAMAKRGQMQLFLVQQRWNRC